MTANKYIGKRFGNLTVVSLARKIGYIKYFNCVCDCGSNHTISFTNMCSKKRNEEKHCIKCKPKEDIQSHIGKKYGGWFVVSFIESKKVGSQLYHYYLCRCECGLEKSVQLGNLKRGLSNGCGCKPHKTKYSNIKDKSLLNTWHNMISRCYNKKDDNYKNYGGRGITVCVRWRDSFENFIADMGEKPSPKHSIDRINNDGNYEPSNCRWSTQKEQANNTRFSGKLTQINLAQKVGRTREYIRQIWRRDLLQFVFGYIGKSPIFTEDAVQFILDGKHKRKKGRPKGLRNKKNRVATPLYRYSQSSPRSVVANL